MSNGEVAQKLYTFADVLELQHVAWKPRAYRRAAQAIEALSEDVEALWKREGKQGLEEIPCVGTAIASHIEELLKTGRVKKWDNLLKKTPSELHTLLTVQGLGTKKVSTLYEKLGIKNMQSLERAAKKHLLQTLYGFGRKTEDDILTAIHLAKKSAGRLLLGTALVLAEELISTLKERTGVTQIEYAGSIRRKKETIGDIDILCSSAQPEKIVNAFTHLPITKKVLSAGKTRSSILLTSGVQCDLRVVDETSYGAALQYFTGSKEHGIAIRSLAIRKGYKLNEYGLFSRKTNAPIITRTEKDVYALLGLSYIEPELRENTGEIDAALKKKLPTLISLTDIRGDLHMHTTYSDGAQSIEEMTRAAIRHGYEYICITDHSPSTAIAHGLSEKRLLQQWKEIERVQEKVGSRIRILKGSEVDIKRDGTLDYPDELLKKMDVVIAAVHTGFKMTEQEMTKRLVRALEHPLVDMLAHPTGRLLTKRQPYAVDLAKIFTIAKENNKVLEVNSMTDRLDLKDVHIRMAVQKGVKLAINTDSHSTDHLDYMRLGVAQARRGWAEKKDIVNTARLQALKKIFLKIT